MIPRQAFSIHPSKINLYGLGGLFIISMMVILMLPFVLFTKIILFLLLFCYEAAIWWQHGLLEGRDSITQLMCADSHWLLKRGQAWHEAELMGETTVTRMGSILCFRPLDDSRRCLSCVILPDSLRRGEYRRLIQVLKWGSARGDRG